MAEVIITEQTNRGGKRAGRRNCVFQHFLMFRVLSENKASSLIQAILGGDAGATEWLTHGDQWD